MTATLDDAGVAWPERLPAGWTETSTDDGDVGGDVRRAACTPVVAGGSAVIRRRVRGAVTVPTVVPARVRRGYLCARSAWSVTPGTGDYTVTVTATVADGYSWGQMGAGVDGVERGDEDVDGRVGWRCRVMR